MNLNKIVMIMIHLFFINNFYIIIILDYFLDSKKLQVIN